MSALDDLLQSYRAASITEREKGTYFERLVAAYLQADPIQAEEFSQVWMWADWAKEQGRDGKDIGIDLVAKLRNEDGYAAIQAKFYAADTHISKAHIDGFISASGKAPFRRRVFVDSTEGAWSANAEEMIRGQAIPVTRIGLSDLRGSPIDWAAFGTRGEVVLFEKKTLRPHQEEALEAVRDGLADADRGKLIMACGTGKTFTSLKIAEDLAGPGKLVLFMVPSLALMAQSIREWVNDAAVPLRAFSVCSDSQVGKRRKASDDVAEIEIHDLALPATTNAGKIAAEASQAAPDRMTVIFSTYQSINTLTEAQAKGLPDFDLIICDEAHRTTGVTLADDDDSNFVRIHSDSYVRGRKRLYMTATPRVFGNNARSKADEFGAELADMDDPAKFGHTLFHRGFGWAVQNDLLTDYKVIVLAMDEGLVSASVQKRLAAADSELVLDDATKIVGCYKALAKQDLKQDLTADPQPMRRALAFCKSIAASKLIRDEFSAVVEEYTDTAPLIDDGTGAADLRVEIEHVDGTFNAKSRGQLLDWLKAGGDETTCRILTNARCLSEGVDVPALDAIMFLHPRKSQIDVVQSVGRVMRKAPGKRMGYVILPVGVPAGMEPEQALKDNEKYRVVWQILNALRAHDDRFDAMINQMSLGQMSDRVEIVGITAQSEELKAITATVDALPSKAKAATASIGQGSLDDLTIEKDVLPEQFEIGFPVDEFSRAIIAKIVKKCGTRDYWEDWATNIADIAQAHISRLEGILAAPGTPARQAFDAFLEELRDDLNDGITEADAIEMLAQHIITRPVFETLFEGHQFTTENPVSRAIQGILGVLTEANLDKESRDLEKFYASVRFRAQGLTDPKAKQRLIVELYDKFFARAFKRTTEKLGIVYTPVEVIDFIIRSVDDVLRDTFGQTLGSPGVHILDPFTGTGSFITRLLQSGLIAPEEMEHKYRHEIHANEIVLLAYYIAAINIETVYHGVMGGDYVPFEGICLTDTFQMYEKGDLIAQVMPDNSERRKRQRDLDIRVILGNPPYAVAHHIDYPHLDGRIGETFAARSTATNKNALYDSYIRAIRWGADRLGDSGVLAYVTNGGWVDANTADGMRKALADEFSRIYVFHLRGNARTSGEPRRREGGNIFEVGSRAPIVITLFVKDPQAAEQGRISFHDIGDYLSREEKLKRIEGFGSLKGITDGGGWQEIEPDEHGDWLKQRDAGFSNFISIGDKKSNEPAVFENYSAGLKTQRDAWCYNASRALLERNITHTVTYYNGRLAAWQQAQANDPTTSPDSFMAESSKDISWSSGLKSKFEGRKPLTSEEGTYITSLYRPFFKEWLYYSRTMNERVYQMPRVFPDGTKVNRVIMVPGLSSRAAFTALMSNCLPDLNMADGGIQCFPLKLYEQVETSSDDLFANQGAGLVARDGITDAALTHFSAAWPGEDMSKEDIFYYIYGLLHSPDYRDRYADNLLKELPRIPAVKNVEDYRAFRDAGRALGDLHVNYETVEPYPVTFKQGDLRLAHIPDPEAFYRVTKMKFGGSGKTKDRTTVIYNANITIQGIPLEAYDYVVNGKPALEWVMERQGVRQDKDSGIINDANRYAIETMGNPAYPLELFQRVITVSLETMKIVKALPKLEV